MQRLSFNETNGDGNYATHGFFRYFGKLPPAVVRFMIKEGTRDGHEGAVVDLMCGSGTALVESMILGRPSIGVDINPIATLISRVKTNLIDEHTLRDCLHLILERHESISNEEISAQLPRFRNQDYWFNSDVQIDLSRIKGTIATIEEVRCRDFFTVAFLSIIRRVSNGSTRIGRLFHEDKKPVSVKAFFVDKANGMIKKMQELRLLTTTTEAQVLCEDARETSIAASSAAFVIVHPPYFALYKYSSDVLRFELEWLGANRKEISAHEVEDGFKTTNLGIYPRYIEDVAAVLSEAQRILKPGCQVCLVVNNSTFREQRLPVVQDVCAYVDSHVNGLKMVDCLERGLRFQQASYHKSAREDKITSEDYLVYFQKILVAPRVRQ
jgi:hypothetical protein